MLKFFNKRSRMMKDINFAVFKLNKNQNLLVVLKYLKIFLFKFFVSCKFYKITNLKNYIAFINI